MLKKELTRYLIVGVSAVLTDFITYRLLSLFLLISVAKTISYILGMIVSFYVNRSWTFNSQGEMRKDFSKFVVLYLGSLFLNVLSNHLTLFLFPYAITFAFLVATGVSVITNYVGQKYWVFRK
jgi:putative flippase GtrA